HGGGRLVGRRLRPPGEPQQCPLADVGLDAAALAAVAWWAVRVDHVVPDLARVPVMTVQRPPIGDDASADTDPAEQEHHVVDAARTATMVLGKHGEVGVIAHCERQAAWRLLRELRAERYVVPAEVRR